MSSDAEVMRQFLISLGFKVDEVSQRKFDTTVLKTDDTIKKIGGAIRDTAIEAQKMVMNVANSLERLYYSAQNISESGTPTSVGDIQAASYAGRQIGLNAETIQRAMQNMASAIRENPGLEAVISGLTGKPVKGRKMNDVLQDTIQELSKMPDFFATRQAQQFGLDPNTYIALKLHLDEFIQAEERQRQIMKEMGVDPEKAAKAMKEYNQQLNDTLTKIEVLGQKVAMNLLPAFRKVNNFISNIVTTLSHMFDAANKVKFTGNPVEDFFNLAGAMGNAAAKDIVDYNAEPASVHKISGKVVDETSASSPAQSLPKTRGARNNNPGNVKYGPRAISFGATGMDAQGFAIFPTMQAGVNAMSAVLRSYAAAGNDTIAGILGTYAPQTDNNDVPAYSAWISKQMGVGAGQHLNLADNSVLSSLVGNISRYESNFNPLQMKGITLQQTNHITVTGAGSPESTGRVVMESMNRVNANLTRDLRGAHR